MAIDCHINGVYLVSVTDSEENDFVEGIIAYGDFNYWIAIMSDYWPSACSAMHTEQLRIMRS